MVPVVAANLLRVCVEISSDEPSVARSVVAAASAPVTQFVCGVCTLEKAEHGGDGAPATNPGSVALALSLPPVLSCWRVKP